MTPEEITSALAEVLADAGVHGPVTDLRRLTGGASRETWAFAVGDDGYILQRARAGSPRADGMILEADLLRAAEGAGVPVARVVSAGTDGPLGAGHLISAFIEGESIARRIQRDDAFAEARPLLVAQCGRALARIHSIDPSSVQGLAGDDQIGQYRKVLDDFGDRIAAFELAFAWLDANRPSANAPAIVHGDFRLGNLMVGADGLRAVIDWELAHTGDPMEDLGWLCVRAWRFGQQPPVAGLGSYDELFAAYEEVSGTPVDAAVVRWWEVLGTLKWGIMCIMQARTHLEGFARSVELAAIGRRVAENEADLAALLAPEALDAARSRPEVTADGAPSFFGRPTAGELVEAVAEYVTGDVAVNTEGRTKFHARVASNVLATVQRELAIGPALARRGLDALATIGHADEASLADAVAAGDVDPADPQVWQVVAGLAVDKLAVANPGYLAD